MIYNAPLNKNALTVRFAVEPGFLKGHWVVDRLAQEAARQVYANKVYPPYRIRFCLWFACREDAERDAAERNKELCQKLA